MSNQSTSRIFLKENKKKIVAISVLVITLISLALFPYPNQQNNGGSAGTNQNPATPSAPNNNYNPSNSRIGHDGVTTIVQAPANNVGSSQTSTTTSISTSSQLNDAQTNTVSTTSTTSTSEKTASSTTSSSTHSSTQSTSTTTDGDDSQSSSSSSGTSSMTTTTITSCNFHPEPHNQRADNFLDQLFLWLQSFARGISKHCCE
jgi:hypothetical protein